MAIINNKLEGIENSAWKRAETKFKEWIYILIHELSESQIFTPNLYKLLILIETCQFLWYTMNPKYTFLWDLEIFTWIKTALKYFQFDGIASEENGSIFLILLYTAFGLTMISTITTIMISINLIQRIGKVKEQNSSMFNYALKAISGYNILLITILSFPFYFIFIATFICHEDNPIHGTIQCYQGTYFIHIVIATIGLIFLIGPSFLFGILSMDLNPWSKMPYAAPGSRLNILKLVFKMGIVLYSNLDYQGNGSKAFLIIFGVFWFLVLVLRYKQTPCYNRSVFHFMLGNEVTIFWSSLISIFHALLDQPPPDNIGLVFLVIGIPPLIFCYIIIVNLRSSYFRKLHIKNFQRDTDFEMYLLNIISLIENRTDPDKRMSLEGLLKFHIKHCHRSDQECPCYSLAKDFLKEDQDAPEKLWYLWIRVLMKEAIERFQKSARLHVLYAYIEREKLDNKFKALYELMQAQNQRLSLEEEFSIYRYKMIIETEMIENDVRATELKGGVDVNLVVEFQKKFIVFQEAIETSVELHLAFWKELQETNPDIQKLQSLGSRIASSVEETAGQFKRLSNINSNQRKMLDIYGNFLKDIVNDEIESQFILEKVDYVDRSTLLNKQFMDNDKLKYGENSNTCLITVSCNYNNMGLVTTINNEITRILGFHKEEILEKNINQIIPKVLSELHDTFLQNYFDTSQGKIIGIERVVFPINKQGYLVPCTLMIKVLPNLDEGIRLVGFLKEIGKDNDPNKPVQDPEKENDKDDVETKDNYILYDGITGLVYGITYGCKEDFGIPISLINGASHGSIEFTIGNIFPAFNTYDIEELKSRDGVSMSIDTTNLKENFLTQNAHEDDTFDIDPELKEKRYRSILVNVRLIQNEVYQGLNLRTIRFSEEIRDIENKENVKETKKQDVIDTDAQKSFIGSENTKKQQFDRASSVAGSVTSEDSAIDSEEVKLIKDYKILISAKTTPKSIIILRNVIGLISLAVIMLISIILSLRLNQNSEFQSKIQALDNSFQRNVLLAQINFKMRNLYLLDTNLLNTPSSTTAAYFEKLQTESIALINALRAVNLNIASNKNSDVTESVPTETLIQSTVDIKSQIFSDAMNQYMAHSTSAAKSELGSFISTDPTVTIPSSFFYVKRNGYGVLRYQSDINAEAFFGYSSDRTNKFNIRFEIIMLTAIGLLVIVESILIPIVFSVHKTATRVLSLFGYISLNEIRHMAEKCEKYMEVHLEEHRKLTKMSFEDDGNAENYRSTKRGIYQEIEQNQNQPETPMQADVLDISQKLESSMDMLSAKKKPETSMRQNGGKSAFTNALNLKIISPEHLYTSEPLKTHTEVDDQRIMINRPSSPFAQHLTNQFGKEGHQNHEEEPEAQEDRSQKLMNSKENVRIKVIVQFAIIGLLYMAYFIGDFLHNKSVLDDIRVSLNYFKINLEIEPDLRFLNDFTLEEIVEVNPSTIYQYSYSDWINLRVAYKQSTLTNLQLISSSKLQNFPSSFNSYITKFNSLSNGNLCTNFYNENSQTIADCNAVSDGVLVQGLTIAITRVIQNSDDILMSFNTTAKDNVAKSNYINNDFAMTDEIVEKITPVLADLKSEFMNSFLKFLKNANTLEKIKFIIFLILGVLSFLFLWIPYRKSLNGKIYKTKGMLKMIPMEIISKDENLKHLFLSGNILQAVK